MTALPEGFVRLPQSGDVIAVEAIAAVYTAERAGGHMAVVETRGGRFRFKIPAKDEQDAGLLRDEIVRDMWKAKRPAKAEVST